MVMATASLIRLSAAILSSIRRCLLWARHSKWDAPLSTRWASWWVKLKTSTEMIKWWTRVCYHRLLWETQRTRGTYQKQSWGRHRNCKRSKARRRSTSWTWRLTHVQESRITSTRSWVVVVRKLILRCQGLACVRTSTTATTTFTSRRKSVALYNDSTSLTTIWRQESSTTYCVRQSKRRS